MIQGSTKSSRGKPSSADPRPPRFVVLDDNDQWLIDLGGDATVVCHCEADVREVLKRTGPETLWISTDSNMTEELARMLVDSYSAKPTRPGRRGDLLLLHASKVQMLPTLRNLFGSVIGATRQFKHLSRHELIEVLAAPLDIRRDLLIGGVVCGELGSLVLTRGNLEEVVVPLAIFRDSGKSTPDFGKLEFGDYGQTIRFGRYEATTDVVLWESDPDYRKRAKARQRSIAKGFGPSLRRLRIQRGFTQSDFPGVAQKTIARIESGEVEKPRGATLDRIVGALGVSAEDIETY